MTREKIQEEAEKRYDDNGYTHLEVEMRAMKRTFIAGCNLLLPEIEKECIAFAEWTFKKGWVLCTEDKNGTSFWMPLEAMEPNGSTEKSTTELFHLYQKEKEG